MIMSDGGGGSGEGCGGKGEGAVGYKARWRQSVDRRPSGMGIKGMGKEEAEECVRWCFAGRGDGCVGDVEGAEQY